MKRLFIDGVTKRSRKVSEVNPRVSIDLEQYVRQVIAAVGGGSGSSYTFENALTEASTVVKLGGSLTQPTNIDGDASTGFGGLNQLWFTNLNTFLVTANGSGSNPFTGINYQLNLNQAGSTSLPLNGLPSASLSYEKGSGYGAGYFLTEDGLDPRPYIVSEMEYGGGAARTAKIEFSNDFILTSHKIYSVANPTDIYREYLVRCGDSQLTLSSINADNTVPNDITQNIVNTMELSPLGIRMTSQSNTGTPTFDYIFPITSLTKPSPQAGYSMVINSTNNNFDFVKDYKCINQVIFAVGETVTAKTIKLVAPYDNYILQSVSIAQPSGGGTVNLKVSKLAQSQDILIAAGGLVSTHLITSITNPIVSAEAVNIEINSISGPMTQLSVTLNFLYAG